jgi:uncharacterized membrane protein
MDDRTLKILNVMAVLAILLIGVFSWIYMRDQFMWGIRLMELILLLVLLLNIRHVLMRYVKERRKSMNKETDVKADRRLNIINDVAIIAALVIAAFSWIYMRDQFMWGIVLIALILLLVGCINAMKIIADVS